MELHIFESGEKTRSKACDGEFFRFLATGLIGRVTADKANAISFTSFVKVSRCHLTLTLAPTSLSSRVGPQAYGKGQIIGTEKHDRKHGPQMVVKSKGHLPGFSGEIWVGEIM